MKVCLSGIVTTVLSIALTTARLYHRRFPNQKFSEPSMQKLQCSNFSRLPRFALAAAALVQFTACGGGQTGTSQPQPQVQQVRTAAITALLNDANVIGWSNGIAVDAAGTIYIANADTRTVNKMSAGGQVSVLAGPGPGGQVDGTGSAASFVAPDALALDADGNLLVADSVAIRKVSPAGVVTTRVPAPPGSEASDGRTVPMYQLVGVAVTPAGDIYDTYTWGTRRTTSTGTVTIDGTPIPAQLQWPTNTPYISPRGIAADHNGNVYFADQRGGAIDKVTPDGKLSVFAGTSGAYGNADGTGTAASFGLTISGLAIDGAGNLYVADADNLIVRKITPAGVVTTLAGSSSTVQRPAGSLSWPMAPLPPGALTWPMTSLRSIAVDNNGYVYVTSGSSLLKIGPVQ
jgi:sugar lactone lactonase YvrE